MARRPTVHEALALRTDEYRRAALSQSYRELIVELRELLPLASGPNPPAPRLTARLALLDTLSGYTPPKDTLTARDVLAIATAKGAGLASPEGLQGSRGSGVSGP